MAWQLIYTSSARLLEAGRTGFGTVAKHRAISALLTGKLESISQFARLPGYDPDRIIYSHRLMEAGARRFHVLSSIRNAGSDYSGRTNHIAHHLVITEEEVRLVSRSSVTPADILLAMDWRTSWDSDSRYLEEAEEVDLSQVRAHAFDVWGGVTGRADHARLPWSAQAGRGCSMVIPDRADARLFAGEALMHNPAQSWEISFTTHLEPNDSLSDFRWVFLHPDSAARSQADQSTRPLYDLLLPSLLPAPPAPLQPALTKVPSPAHHPAPVPSFRTPPPPSGLDKGSLWGLEKLVDAKAGRRAIPGAPLMERGNSSTAHSEKKNSRKWAFIAASLIIVVVAAAAVIHLLQERAELKSQKEALSTRVVKVWSKVLIDEKKSVQIEQIKKASSKNINDIEGTIKELEELIQSVDVSLEEHTDKTKAISSNDTSLEPFRSLQSSVKDWFTHQDKLRELFKAEKVTWSRFYEAMIAENDSWGKIQSTYRASEKPHQELIDEAKAFVIKEIKEKSCSLKDYDDVNAVLNKLGPDAATQVKGIMECWGQLAQIKSNSGERLGENDYQRWMKSDTLPKWLRDEVEKFRPPSPVIAKPTPAPEPRAAMPIQAPAPAIQRPPDPTSTPKPTSDQVETYIVILKEDGSIESPDLPIKSDMVLEVHSLASPKVTIKLNKMDPKSNGASELLAKPAIMSDGKDAFEFVERRLHRLPKEGVLTKGGMTIDCNSGFRMTSDSEKPLSFEIIALSTKAVPTTELLPTTRQGQISSAGTSGYSLALKPGIEALKWPETSVCYILRPANLMDGGTSKDLRLTPAATNKSLFNIEAKKTNYLGQINNDLKNANADLSEENNRKDALSDEKWDLETNKKNLAEALKTEKLKTINENLRKVGQKIEELKKQIAGLEAQQKAPPPPPPKPAAGPYHLFANVGGRYFKICLVDLP